MRLVSSLLGAAANPSREKLTHSPLDGKPF
jgi:hypothetical protein